MVGNFRASLDFLCRHLPITKTAIISWVFHAFKKFKLPIYTIVPLSMSTVKNRYPPLAHQEGPQLDEMECAFRAKKRFNKNCFPLAFSIVKNLRPNNRERWNLLGHLSYATKG